MEILLILAPVGVTSLAGYLVGRRWLRLRPAAVRDTGIRVLECVGLTVIFLAVNLALGTLLILGYRGLAGRFLSVYAINDVTIVLLSVLQAIFLRWWWDTAA